MAISDQLVKGENFLNHANKILSYYDKPYCNPNNIKDGDIVYCDTRSLYKYKNVLLNCKDLVIITHNCIGHVKDDIHPSRSEDINTNDFDGCYRLWFAKNSFSTKKNIYPIPLGFENKRWDKNGIKRQTFNNIKQIEPTKIAYLNCRVGTNANIRQDCVNKCKNMNFVDIDNPNLRFDNFMNTMLNYKFILSPDGRGADCHRTYEALFLHRIPVILEQHPLRSLYDNLPVLYVSGWDKLKEIDLDQFYNTNKGKFNDEFLLQSYWDKKIKELCNE